MQPTQWEIILLKPSPPFLSFIEAQMPLASLPEYRLLQTNNTGYVLEQQESEEALLDEIERLYPQIFKYEIQRWVGPHAVESIKTSFLDFLCCFKFDLHTHILLMEPSIVDANQLISIKPRSTLTKCVGMQRLVSAEGGVVSQETVALSQWIEDATVIAKNLEQVYDLKPFLKRYYNEIYEAERTRLGETGIDWPVIDSYQMFCRYFAAEFHTQLVHLL